MRRPDGSSGLPSARWGALLYGALFLLGTSILAAYFLVPALVADDSSLRLGAMQVGALLALPPLVVFFWVQRIVGRLDPEPFHQLAISFFWGAFAASGLSAFGNTVFENIAKALLGGTGDGDVLAYAIAASFGAPLIEEVWKGLPVLFAFWLFRRGADGLADGVLYASFSALGFATMENVLYYARAALEEVAHREQGALAAVVVIRGVLSPWGHPLYTSMTGLGFGLARESTHPRVKRSAPIFGLLLAISLHAAWNGAALITDDFTRILLPLCVVVVIGFAALVTALSARQIRILRRHLAPEIARGTLRAEEVELVVSPFARLRATLSHGGIVGQDFVATAARLAFDEWQRERARCLGLPPPPAEPSEVLRRRLAELRARIERRASRRSPSVHEALVPRERP